MTFRNLEPSIAEHPFFQQLEPRYVALIAGCARNEVFHEDEFIFRLGAPADTFYIVRHGKVALEAPGPMQESRRILTIDAGELLGWSWLFPPYQWMFDARALSLTRTVVVDGRCLREKCEADHSFGYELMKRFSALMGTRFEEACMQMMDVYARGP